MCFSDVCVYVFCVKLNVFDPRGYRRTAARPPRGTCRLLQCVTVHCDHSDDANRSAKFQGLLFYNPRGKTNKGDRKQTENDAFSQEKSHYALIGFCH